MPKKKPKQPASDAEDLKALVVACIAGGPRGTLTRFAEQCGMTTSAFRKRLTLPGAGFDLPTLRILITMIRLKSTEPLSPAATRHGDYLIETQNGEPRWQTAE